MAKEQPKAVKVLLKYVLPAIGAILLSVFIFVVIKAA